MPDGFRADHVENRMTFTESGALRSPMVIELWLAAGPPTPATSLEQRSLTGGPVRYVEEVREGGSGGSEHVLLAWRAVGERTLVMEASAQRESGKPNFAVAWQALEGARVAD
ncbi:MAG: Tsi3 family protein [Nannocystales bacterium]